MNRKSKSRKGERKIEIAKIILSIIGLTACVALAAIAPGALKVLKTFGFGERELRRREHYIDSSLKRLMVRGLITKEAKRGESVLTLTSKGRQVLFRYQAKQLGQDRPAKWDGKYRVVAFDIKEYERFVRDEMRILLLNFGFLKLQNSLWVYPYPCKGFINLLKANLKIGDELVYMEVDRIEGAEKLRSRFGMK